MFVPLCIIVSSTKVSGVYRHWTKACPSPLPSVSRPAAPGVELSNFQLFLNLCRRPGRDSHSSLSSLSTSKILGFQVVVEKSWLHQVLVIASLHGFCMSSC